MAPAMPNGTAPRTMNGWVYDLKTIASRAYIMNSASTIPEARLAKLSD